MLSIAATSESPETAARLAGVRVGAVLVVLYLISGVLAGVALYGRALTAAEVGEDYLRYQAVREERAERREAPRLAVRATLTETSESPTLVEISPYREALIVHEYRLERIVSGSYDADPERIRVAHWAILDGQDQPAARFRPGREATLELTPLAGNPQLESVFVKDTLEPAWELPVYYDAGGPESAASRSTSGASATPGGGSIVHARSSGASKRARARVDRMRSASALRARRSGATASKYSRPSRRSSSSRPMSRPRRAVMRCADPSYSPTTPATGSRRSTIATNRPRRSKISWLTRGRGSPASSSHTNRIRHSAGDRLRSEA